MGRDDDNYSGSDDCKRTRTEIVTLKLPSTLIDELRRDADFEGVSLNNFVAKIVSNDIR